MPNSKLCANKRFYVAVAIFACLCVGCSESSQAPETIYETVELTTTMGSITLQLNYSRAPVSVENFLEYVESSFFDSTVFHRVVEGFLIQGGQYTQDLSKKEANETIVCESDNGLLNVRGTIAMARGISPDSGASQWFINLTDNTALDRQDDQNLIGYAVFGRVTIGMDIVDAIAAVSTSTQQMPDGTPMTNVPESPVIVFSVCRFE